MRPRFFTTPEDFRAWLATHHASETELLVGFWKTHTGKPSITWPQSVDEALCVGWIDGVRRSTGDESYTIRFTPRKPGSIWSAVNTKRMQALIATGRVLPAGSAAFALRKAEKSVVYSYENRPERLPPGVNLQSTKMGMHEWAYANDYNPAERRLMPHVSLKERFKKLNIEVELGFTAEQIEKEVQRCLNCDVQTVFETKLCIECDACIDICPVDCLTITHNGEEAELRTRLKAPAKNVTQALYVSSPLKHTARVMVKDEDLCVHCGLCAERCPTAAWDMQKSTIQWPHAKDEAAANAAKMPKSA